MTGGATTRNADLLAIMSHRCIRPGLWRIAEATVERKRITVQPPGNRPSKLAWRWVVDLPDVHVACKTFTEALEVVSAQRQHRRMS